MKRGKTSVLDPLDARKLIDTIDVTTQIGLRDRALIGMMVYSFARIGAVTGMKFEDASPPILKTAGPSSAPRQLQTTARQERHSFMIAAPRM